MFLTHFCFAATILIYAAEPSPKQLRHSRNKTCTNIHFDTTLIWNAWYICTFWALFGASAAFWTEITRATFSYRVIFRINVPDVITSLVRLFMISDDIIWRIKRQIWQLYIEIDYVCEGMTGVKCQMSPYTFRQDTLAISRHWTQNIHP